MRKSAAVTEAPGFPSKLKSIPLTQIELPQSNTRKHMDAAKLKELTASIKQQGVLQPILLRQLSGTNGHAHYQIIVGERRFRAAQAAGLTEIPASIRALDEAQTLSANLTENLQREEIHPLDEAAGLLRMKEELKLDLRAIAQRLGKDARYVARRLALTNLIAAAQTDLRKAHITLGHALELCRLTPEIQPHALAACYEQRYQINPQTKTQEMLPDKTLPVRPVAYLQDWIVRNVHLKLQRAPFKLDDVSLRADGLTCLTCPNRTGFNKTLFADITNAETCLDPLCFQGKVNALVQIKAAELTKKHGKPVAQISPFHSSQTQREADSPVVLGREQFVPIERRAQRCQYAEQAVYAHGNEVGQARWICRAPDCPDHQGRAPERTAARVAHAVTASQTAGQTTAQQARKQELFEMRVNEATRKRVMKAALATFIWPLDRAHLNEVAQEFFRHIPSEHKKVIAEIMEWDDKASERLRYDETLLLDELAQYDDTRLAQFMMLCSFAHYGANHYGNHQIDQSAVIELSAARDINYALLDAEVRAELCAKKYKDAHLTYLTAVQSGEVTEKPIVYSMQAESALAG